MNKITKIISFNKPYLVFDTKNMKKELGISSGLIDLLNQCNSKIEFENKLKFHLNNIFITEEIKRKIINYINLNTKIRCIIKKHIQIKKKNNTEFNNDTDLMSFDNINEVNKNDIFIIYDKDEQKKYWFQTDTLVKLVNQALTNSTNIIEINSKKPYNPYNRKDFNKFELNSIFNYLLKKNKLPILLHLYKISNYNIKNFMYVNKVFLDDYIIKNLDDEEPHDLLNYFEEICIDNKINFSRYDIIIDNLEKYIGQIKDIIRFSYRSNFRDLPIKELIEFFIINEIYDGNECLEDYIGQKNNILNTEEV